MSNRRKQQRALEQQKKQRRQETICLLPVLLALGVVPLIVIAKKYEVALSEFDWFSNIHSSVDVFLYWKGQGLILLAFLMILSFLILLGNREYTLQMWKKLKTPATACMGIYLLFAVLSTIFSEYQDSALWGGYEQWEGLNVLAAYIVLVLFTYVAVDSERAVHLVVYSILIGGFVLGLIGTFQYLGMDLFRSSFGKGIMSLLSESKMNYSFNFPDGWVYATLYNPNYVGSYAALVLPVVIAVAVIEWKKISKYWTVLAMVTTCLITITLLGSQSLTGCVGVFAGLMLVLIYTWRRMWTKLGWKKILTGAVILGVFVGVMMFIYPEEIRFGLDKLFHPKEDYHLIQRMDSTDKGLEITTVKGEVLYVRVTGDDRNPIEIADAQDKPVSMEYNGTNNYYTVTDSRFENFRLYAERISVDGTQYPAVSVFNPPINKKWTIAKVNRDYMVYNKHQKLDELREIPAWGFENCQHFGDKRGYIWSRTFPLLKDSMLLGTGPDTFTMVFPNDDYVGKTNMNYDGVAVTKPHNMYLQIWVQTGFLSLAAFLLVFLFYFIDSLKLYYNRESYGVVEKFGISFMIATFGYMVTGLANDSSVSVAPVYWGILGLGMATNCIVKRGRKTSDNIDRQA